jgi:protein-S-isoprenylcysteine O-methyltransferase Ste14
MPSTPTTEAPPSAAEQTPSARAGAVLFRNRSWLPVPFLLVALFAPGRMTATTWIVGAVLIVLGEWVRLAGVAAAGTVTRRRSRNVQRLVTYGIFQWVRNPLYVGNFLIWMGFVVISGVLWFLPIAIALFAVEYTLIVAYEEGVLESIFGQEYIDYRGMAPRWIPRPPRRDTRRTGEHDWGEAWRSETSTFLQYAVLVLIFVGKQRFMAR